MAEKVMNNEFNITGIIKEELVFNNEIYGEKFYKTYIKVKRLSGVDDIIPMIVSERLLSKMVKEEKFRGKRVEISGQFRSFNKLEDDGHRHLELYLFVREIKIYNEDEELRLGNNLIRLDGYVCKKPVLRKTPLGKKLTDLCIAVNRPFGKTDYIPCIAWERNAIWANEFEVGTHVKLEGRIQSRQYLKRSKTNEEDVKEKIAYEVSIISIKKLGQ